ncbi:MAG: S-layer homology domain-containing protein [Oscillospiraceae bacterium]|nr:S-layer homology domain-containing protein [Oscillospiraceae bacterium]
MDDDAELGKLYEVGLSDIAVAAGSTQNYADLSALTKVTPHFVFVTTPSAPSTPDKDPVDTPDDKDDEGETDKPVVTPDTPENPFKDVANGVYYFEPVLWAVENNITSGTSATAFSPDLSCTRGQTVTFLWRAAGCPKPTLTENPFTDVAPGSYYYDAVLWAVEKGITTGMTETTFEPDATVNRAQTVTFLWRSAAKPEVSVANPFTDVKAGEYFEKAVLWAASENITTGTSATTFAPNSECTRGQIVTFIYRLYNK